MSFPVAKKAAYVKFPQPASRFALVGVFVAQTSSGVRVAVTGAGPSVFRAKAMEDALAKSFTADAAKAVTHRCRGPQQRHPRIGGIPRAPRAGARVARGDGGGLI